MNRITLYGNVGKDPEVKHFDNGKAVASFSMATSESYKNKQGEKVVNTEWHNIVAWSPLAEIFEKHVKKGNKILITGKSVTREYESNGEKKYITEVQVKDFEFGQSSNSESGSKDINNPDDLPF